MTVNAAAVVTGNNIYTKTSLTRSLLIHELTHVWQYQQEQIGVAKAFFHHIVKGAVAAVTPKTYQELVYNYTPDDLHDEKRRTFREYSFEQQATILQDAYRLLHLNRAPIYNTDYSDAMEDYWKEYYNALLEEFRQWHQELQRQSLSPDYLDYN